MNILVVAEVLAAVGIGGAIASAVELGLAGLAVAKGYDLISNINKK